jgi:hypothetical protein
MLGTALLKVISDRAPDLFTRDGHYRIVASSILLAEILRLS